MKTSLALLVSILVSLLLLGCGDKGETSVSINGPDGERASLSTSEKPTDVGIPAYPGASMDSTPSMTIDTDEEKVEASTYISKDPLDKVVEFYAKELAGAKKTQVDKVVVFQLVEGKVDRNATITEKDGSVKIELMRHEKKK